MAIEVKIPSMGESITSGVLSKWHVADGAVVKKDQPLFELETDKITSEGTAEVARILAEDEAGIADGVGRVGGTVAAGGVVRGHHERCPVDGQAPVDELDQIPLSRRRGDDLGRVEAGGGVGGMWGDLSNKVANNM